MCRVLSAISYRLELSKTSPLKIITFLFPNITKLLQVLWLMSYAWSILNCMPLKYVWQLKSLSTKIFFSGQLKREFFKRQLFNVILLNYFKVQIDFSNFIFHWMIPILINDQLSNLWHVSSFFSIQQNYF